MKTAARRVARTLQIILRSASFAGMLTTVALMKSSSAQSDVPAPISEPADYPAFAKSDLQSLTDSAPLIADAPGPDEDSDDEQPPVVDLVTGLRLRTLLTPFHWGRFSLLSSTVYEGYNSNPEFQKTPLGAAVTSMSALVIYSSQFAGWRMNVQYQPFIWISSRETLKDFAAASVDLRTLRHINETWHWTLGERLRYSPTHSVEEGKGFVADPGGGFSV